MIKKLFIGLGLLLVTAIGGGVYGYFKLNQLAQKTIVFNDELFVIEKGTSSQKLAKQLETAGLIDSNEAVLFPYLIRLRPELSKFKAGAYSLKGIGSMGELLAHFNSGKEVQLTVQFIEGKTFKTWRSQLAKAHYLTQTLVGKSESEIAKLLDIPHEKVEGWLAPDTYSYTPNSDDLALLKRAVQKQQQALAMAWQNRSQNLPLANPYEMLILASIVEKETALASERPQVASVFINRLKHHWKLQTDPTVIYGMGDRYDGNIRKKDLLDPTPYNTYVIDGLPPTPIAMPSLASLQAVAHPADTPYFYFVANGAGGHTFSRTLDEHSKAVREWIKIEREKKKEKKG